jgi:gamma-glutamylcysteine synthetase
VLGFESAKLETRLHTITLVRRAVLDAVLDIQATIVSRLGNRGLFPFSLPFSFGRQFRIRVARKF